VIAPPASRGVREHHGKDESYFPYAPPDAVVFPESTEEVRAIVDLCRRHKTPLIPFGVGTSLEGHVLAIRGGVCVDLSRHEQGAHRARGRSRRGGAGGRDEKATERAHPPHRPFSFPSIPVRTRLSGAWPRRAASGTNAVRYGHHARERPRDDRGPRRRPRHHHLAPLAQVGGGYELTRLFIGSEGTLGVITELTVRLYPVPEAISSAICSFPDIAGAVDTVIHTLQAGIPIARSEALCATTMKAINAHSKTAYRAQPTLFLEFHGTQAGVEEQAKLVQDIARENGGKDFEWTTKAEERNRLWNARHQAYFACLQLRPGTRAVSTDVCVPISRLTECILETSADIARALDADPAVWARRRRQLPLSDPDSPRERGRARGGAQPSTSAFE